ncbi:MAG: tetratricopeptide repeat protein [Pirellulaceae bacterium]
MTEDKLDESLKQAELAVKANAEDPSALNTLGWVKYKTGDLDGALKSLTEAIRIAPRLPLAYTNRGVVYNDLKQYENALKDLNRSLALQADVPVVYVNRGNVYLNSGDFAKARADYEKAVELSDKIAETNGGLAWLLATCPDESQRDGAKAVELAQKACELTEWKEANYLDTLAAAFAEQGKFEEAAKYAQQAIDNAKSEGDAGKFTTRRDLFRNGEVYRSDVSK